MTDQIHVISADLDGAELRREKHKNRYHARCDGKGDNEQIQDALDSVGKTQFFLPAALWQRVFGGKHGRR